MISLKWIGAGVGTALTATTVGVGVTRPSSIFGGRTCECECECECESTECKLPEGCDLCICKEKEK